MRGDSNSKLMLDTNVFNDLCDEKIDLKIFDNFERLVVTVQLDELLNTPDDERRSRLLSTFKRVEAETAVAEKGVWGVTKWGASKWSDGSRYNQMRSRLQELQRSKRKNLNTLNIARDIVIAETAIANNAILVSRDKNLKIVTKEFGGTVKSPDEFTLPESD